MATVVTMPRLSDSMEEGTVVKWLVEVGGPVKRGQEIVEIDTDKATMSYEAEQDGVLLAILVAEGETAPIGAPIAQIGAAGESVAESPAAAAPEESAASAAAAPAEAPAAAPAREGRGAKASASPIARRLAKELGVDLDTLSGTGPGGMITKTDIEQAAQGGQAAVAAAAGDTPPKGEVTVVEPSRLQQTIARRMVEGYSEPNFAVEVEIDMGACAALRAELGEAGGSKPSYNDLVVKAAALALRDFPRLNGAYTERGFELYGRVNVGIAVATEDTLLVPTIFDADRKPLTAIASESKALAAKVRDRTIAAAELEGGTFTVTNLGMLGVRRFFPILNPPQAAILAVGDVAKRPVAREDGALLVSDVMSTTLTCDHRIVYGADAARFLARVRELLAEPSQLA
jgi:pyruvate dehydrogenase E2 component (dihydrolipoyllysine-residue acetyltransferase)